MATIAYRTELCKACGGDGNDGGNRACESCGGSGTIMRLSDEDRESAGWGNPTNPSTCWETRQGIVCQPDGLPQPTWADEG